MTQRSTQPPGRGPRPSGGWQVTPTGSDKYVATLTCGDAYEIVAFHDPEGASERPPVHCDWLSMHAELPPGTPDLNAGAVLSVDAAGEIEWSTPRWIEHRGSHDTTVRLRIAGERMTLAGNVGRFGRTDNVAGASVADCVELARRLVYQAGKVEVEPARIRLTRVDLCTHVAGDRGDCSRAILASLATRALPRMRRQVYDSAVAWHTRRRVVRVYHKAAEMIAHGKRSARDPRLIGALDAHGVMRVELEMRHAQLAENGLQDPRAWTAEKQRAIMRALIEDLDMSTEHRNPDAELSGRAGELLELWRHGVDVWQRLSSASSRATAHRYRLMIRKATGVDIRERHPVLRAMPLKPAPAIRVVPWYPPTEYTFAHPLCTPAENARINREVHGWPPADDEDPA